MYSTRFIKSGLLLAAVMLGLLLGTGAAQGVSAPEFNSQAGGYYTQKAVAVSCATAGATIYYTLDGSVPTTGSPTVVTGGAILVDRYLTLKAAAWLDGDWSAVTSADYAITGQIAAGANYAFVLPSTGANVLAFGDNSTGQLGIGPAGAMAVSTPVTVKSDATTTLDNIIAVAAGSSHSLVLKNDHSVLAFGANGYGQLGANYPSASAFPVPVQGLAGVSISDMAIGSFHNLLLDTTGHVWTFGRNNSGQAGNGGTVTPQSLPSKVKINAATELSGVIQVAAGAGHAVALVSDGSANTLYAWGLGTTGQLLGNGHSVSKSYATPSPVTNIRSVTCGDNFTLVIKNDGTVWGWGSNFTGQLGSGTTSTFLSAVQMLKKSDGTALTGIVSVDGGANHSLALASDGTVWAVGDNINGQLGTGISGTGQKETQAVQVLLAPGRPLRGIVAVAAGGAFSMALGENGIVYVWGRNDKGQFGNGSSGGVVIPYAIAYDKLPALALAPITTHIAAPTAGQILSETPASVLSATVTLAQGAPAIARVDFYASGLLLGSTTSAPYNFSWSPAAPGSYAISAVAVDINGDEWPSQSSFCTVLPVVTLHAPSLATITEDSVAGSVITFTRSSAAPTPLTVSFNTSGTATNGVEYEKLTGNVIIPAGATSASIEIKPIVDARFEFDEMATITLRSSAAYHMAGAPLTVTIVDRLPGSNGLRARFQADAGVTVGAGNKVSSWADQSGSGSVVVQATQALQPSLVLSALSGRPIVRFNGTSNFLQAAAFDLFGGSQEYTSFVVTKPKSTQVADANLLDFNSAAGSGFAIHQAGTSTNLFTGANTPGVALSSTVFQLYSATQSASSQSAYLNGMLMARSSNASSINGTLSRPLSIGGSVDALSSRYFNGDIAEILVYNRALSDAERQQVELYLDSKYSAISTAPTFVVSTVPTAISASQIQLSWLPMSLKNSSFKIERKQEPAGAFVQVASVPGWQLSMIDNGLTPSTTYSYRVTAMLLNKASMASFTPATATTLSTESAVPLDPSVWFRGDSGALWEGTVVASVKQWLNMGSAPIGYANQSNPANRPEYLFATQASSVPVIRFNGTSSSLQTLPFDLIASSPDLTFFVVTQAGEAQSAQATIFDYDNSAGNGLSITHGNGVPNSYSAGSGTLSLNPAVLQLASYSRAGAQETIAVDGVNQYSGTASAAPLAALRALALGGTVSGGASQFYSGDIAEIVIYNRALSTAESAAVSRYLARKYLPGAMDLDGDGLSNTQEVVLLTNPLMWDSNGDGLSDSEDIAQGYDPNRMDLDYDGINNAQEILAGTDPFDFYNGIPPVITIVSGNQQTGAPESVLPVPLKVMLKNAAGEPIVYGPVTFQVVAGGGTLANPQAPEPATFTSSIIIRTTVTGEASVIFKVPVAADFSSVIRASAKGPANPPGIDFTEYNFGATLTFSPAAGHYGSPVSVTVDTTVSAGVIRYTIDGSEPTVSSAELPAEGLSLLRSTRLKARAFHNTTAVSGVSSALYLIGSLISAGDDHTFANGLNGTVYAWGHNSLGQLGNGSRQAQLMPTVISIPSAVDALSGGGEFAIALDEAGVVLGWGDNYFGQLGNNSSEDQLTPLALVSPRSYRAIAAGKDHALAVASDGTVWSWGNGSSGQLGDGTLEGKAAPTQVSGISNVIKVAAGRKFSLAVDQDGRLWAWGLNQSSQIGSDEPDQVSVPVQLPLEGELVQTVSAGATHGLVLTQSGFVYTWGGNGRGELGDATGVSRPVLQRVEGLSDIIAISAGQYHCLALSNTGVVYSWGANDAGQLGDGSHEDRLVPVAVTLPAAALDVAAGMNHSAVVLQDGRIFTFGDNQRGQLGVTTPASSAQPLEVATFHLFNP